MKINGIEKLSVNTAEFSFYRPETGVVTLTFKPVSMEWFNEVVEEPQPPVVTKAGQAPIKDFKNEKYLKAREDYDTKSLQYFIISSLSASADWEWSTVEMEKPDTWENYSKELEDFGFLNTEVSSLIQAVLRANALDSDFIDEKREEFLALRKAEAAAE